MKKYYLTNFIHGNFPLYIEKQASRSRREACHEHDCNEIVFILGGSGVTTVNRHRFPIIKGDLYVMNSKDVHAFETETQLVFYNLMFKNELFSDRELEEMRQFPLFSSLFEQKGALTAKKYSLIPPYSEQVEELMKSMEKELREKRTGWQPAIRGSMMTLMSYLLRYISAGICRVAPEGKSATDAVSRVVNYLHEHYRGKMTMPLLAKIGGVSSGYLGELFKKETGSTIFEYLGKLRVDKARKEIDCSQRNLSEIAQHLGFYDASYFCRSFRKYTGLSPREYEKLVRGSRAAN